VFRNTDPDWEKVTQLKYNGLVVYEIAIRNPDKVGITSKPLTDYDISNYEKNHSLKLLLFADENNKIVKGCYMAIEAGSSAELEKVHYKAVNGLSGYIMYYNLDGTLSNGITYTAGKPTYKMKSVSAEKLMLLKNQNNITLASNGSRVVQGCTTSFIETGYVYCVYTPYSENCGWQSTGYVSYTTCDQDNDIDQDPESYGGGGGGSTSSSQHTYGDREPASYNWRNKLTSSSWGTHLTQDPPHYILNDNNIEVPNPNSFNCHYHTFNLVDPNALIESLASDGWPKVFNNVKLENWKQVTTNIQVGDVVLYFTEGVVNGQSVPNVLSHSGRVVAVDSQGYATQISSKMGVYQVITHHPRDIPASYGKTDAFYSAGGAVYPSRIYFRKK
jgi:hypothetical protein